MKSIKGVWVQMNGDHLAGDRRDRAKREEMQRELYGPATRWGGRLYRQEESGAYSDSLLQPGNYDQLVS